jgi:tetratricopeptide (TPR) repeat protein
MPSHIFTRLGLWDDSIASNLASSAAAQRHVAATHPGATAFDDLHAKDYLEYADLQTGRDAEAFQVVKQISAVSALDNPQFAAAYALAAIPARYAVERRQWDLAAALPLPQGKIPWEKFANAEAIARFARGLGGTRSGRLEDAKRELGRLRAIRDALEMKGDRYWAGQADISALEVDAWIAHAERRDDEALRLAGSAADHEDATDKHPVTPGPVAPARELLADLLSDLNRPADALREYETVLATSPGRFNALEGAGRCARAVGDVGKSKTYYGKLLEQCAHADGRQMILTEARAVAGP